MSDKQSLDTSRRMVVKIGSALLVDQDQGAVHYAWLEALAEDIAGHVKQGREIIIVSSGAIAVGRRYLDLPAGPRKGLPKRDQNWTKMGSESSSKTEPFGGGRKAPKPFEFIAFSSTWAPQKGSISGSSFWQWPPFPYRISFMN